jgi:hypothetical protein
VRVDLPDGQWAELIDITDLRAGDLKAYRRSMPVGEVLTMGDLDRMKDVLLARVITSWSLDLPTPAELPGTPEEAGSLDRLTIGQYRALLDALDPYTDAFTSEEADPKPSPESAGTSKASPSSSKNT